MAIFVSADPALAIPSPELVVGSLTSLSQLAALGSALLGGGAVALSTTRSGSSAAPRLKRLALVFVSVATGLLALNIYQWSADARQEQARLEATLVRPTAKRADGAAIDPKLKEISYDEQVRHPLGISTADAAPVIHEVEAGAATPWVILDIRERPETEMGTFRNARTIRFPDIPTAQIDLKSTKALLICHNGNRSAETCAVLAAKGIDCRFMVGGLEKWMTERRRIGDAPVRPLGETRAIPDYPNSTTLLDTAAAHRLVATEGAVFVDVRYPGAFAQSHLQEAINLPIRPTPTAELQKRLTALPAKPIIAPCYDRRSCFFAQILGLEVTRAGGDFRGRYTLPWEYFTPSQPPPYVKTYLETRTQSLGQQASTALGDALARVASVTGLPLALFMLALLSRLIILPFSIKAERDQITSQEIAGDIARIKAETEGDAARKARALRQLCRTHGLTPGRNLLALLFLPVLALSVEAAVHVAQMQPQSFFWVPSLAGRDATYLLPLVFGGLLCSYIDWALVTSRGQRLAAWLGVAPLLVVAGALLPAAADLYVILSALLLLAQRALVAGLPKRVVAALARSVRRRRDRSLAGLGVVSLDNREALFGAGNKAYRLSLLREAGLPAPAGFVLTDALLARWTQMSDRTRRKLLQRVARRLGSKRFAVRSSGSGEDGADASFAGVFESVLDVQRGDLARAVGDVLASFTSARARSYGEHGLGHNIMIQPMLAPDYAGVLFTRAPDAPGAMLIEAVGGSGEALVSGRATPHSFKAGRFTGGQLSGSSPAINFQPLYRLALAVEAIFETPQDIEWAYEGCTFYLLQARDVTTNNSADTLLRDWRAAGDLATTQNGDDIVLCQTQMSEMLPRPTPASLSLLNDLWASGGSVDLALRSLGLSADFDESGKPLFVCLQGRLYADCQQELRRQPNISQLALRRIRKAADAIAGDFEQRWIVENEKRMRLLAAVDFRTLELDELVSLIGELRQRFVTETYVDVDRINIAAQIFADDMRRAFKADGLDPLDYSNGILNTRASRALRKAEELEDFARIRALRKIIGHRSHFDYELSEPRFGDDLATLKAMARQMSTLPDGAHRIIEAPGGVVAEFERARRFEALKEDAKHLALGELAHLRAALHAAGGVSGLGDAIFFLSLDEIATLDAVTVDELKKRANARQAAHADFADMAPPPTAITLSDLERGPFVAAIATSGSGQALKGERVSGREAVCGRARVVSRRDAEAGRPIPGFAEGDIIVAPMLHPAWLPELVVAGGAVSEIGGWLSHMAIVARERGVAMVTGVGGIERIADGQEIRLESDGRISVVEELPSSAMAAE